MRETTLHDLFNAISCGVEEWALDGRVTYVNPVRKKNLVCLEEERLGQYAWETLSLESDQTHLRERLQNARDSEDPLLPLALTTRDRNGSEFPEEIEWSRKRDAEGRVIGFIVIFHQNPTGLDRLLPPQSGHNQELELLKAINLSIAHDLNSCLAVIVANTESLRSQTAQPDDSIRRPREQILEACERARQLVQHIQSVGYEPAEPRQPVAVGSVVRQTVHWARPLLPTSCQIRCSIETENDRIAAFPHSLYRLLEILCLRVARILQRETATLCLRLQTRHMEADELKCFHGSVAPGPCLSLTLTLEAPALSLRDLQTVFEPYVTLRQSGGTGAGLHLTMLHGTDRQHLIPEADEALRTLWETASASQIVHEHQGALGLVPADNVPPQTTGIVLLFPQEKTENTVSVSVSPPVKPETVPPRPRARLLIAASANAFPISFHERLEFLGYEMDQFSTVARVQSALEETLPQYDVAIVYNSMAGSRTHALIRLMRERRPHLPIILCAPPPKNPSEALPAFPEAHEIIPIPENWREIDLAVRRVRHEFPKPTPGKNLRPGGST